MRKTLKKAIVFIITASFVFNSGLGQMLSYAQTSEIYKNAKSIISNFEVKNIAQTNYSVATANNNSTNSYSLTSEDFTYIEYDSGVIITGYTGEDTEITIPSEIDGMKVTDIGDQAFSSCSALTSVTIPEGVKTIGQSAFSQCSSLTSISLPKGLTTIKNSAFVYCRALKNITIPESVTTIGYSAFEYCSALESITIPEGVTDIDGFTFFYCDSLKSITLPKSLTSIGSRAFERCISLESIDVPKSVTSIGDQAFYVCASLKSITIPEGVTSIEYATFGLCNSLNSIIIPKTVTSIGEYAFTGCTLLKSITIPEGVTSIESYTFYECSSLNNITLPDGITSIGESAFYGCKALESITLPENLTSIGESAFSRCSLLKSITIPKGVTSIERCTFDSCSALTNITISEGVTSIGKYVFSGCSSLESITLPESLIAIGDGAFEHCNSLESITIPEGVTDIESDTFMCCISLTSITLPKSLTSIGTSAFSECSALKSITLPESLTSIESSAFVFCSSLESITIPEGVTSIGVNTFLYCTNLNSIYMPNSIEKIDSTAFINCTNLTMHVYKNSVSETYAIENNIPYVYRDYDDAIVIIPGVMGSRLFSDADGYGEDSLIWEPLVKGVVETYYNLNGLSDRLLSDTYVKPPQIQQFLKAHEDSQEFFGLEYREYGAQDTYKKLVDELCESTDRPVYFFSYNWMQSNSDSADKLKEFIDQFEHVDLVCHSMGGIVASSYMSKYKSDGKVDKIITCGTPYEGSPAIINKMLNWDILIDEDLVFTKEEAKNVLGDIALGLLGGLNRKTKTQITTASELVPSENYVSRVPMYKGGTLFSEAASLDEYKTICKDIFKEKYDAGLIFQEAIKGSSGYNNLLDYENAYFLIGKNKKTIESIVFDKDNLGRAYLIKDLNYETKGDGTVPYISSTMSQAVLRLPEDRYCFAEGSHNQIVQKADTIEWIKQKLGIIEETSTSSDDTTISQEPGGVGYRVLRVACPVDVNIEANGEALNSSESKLDTQTSFGRLDIIGQNDDIKMACLDDIDEYDVTLKGTDEGTMDYTIRYFNSDDELQSETTINDVPITKDTIITTKPVSTEDTVLNVDIDGDGTVDKIYTAPKGETVDVEKVVKFNPNNGDQEIKRAVDSEGKLNYTPEAPTKAGYTFVGWFKDTDDTTTEYKSETTYTEDVTYTAKWAHVDMLGAQVKAVVDDKSGIRFGTKIYNDGDEIVEKGTIILPARLLPEGESLTLDTPKIAQSVGKVNYEVNEEKNYVTYLGTLVGIPSAQFDAEITASAYVIYKDKAGNEYTVYSPYKKGSTTINKLLNS